MTRARVLPQNQVERSLLLRNDFLLVALTQQQFLIRSFLEKDLGSIYCLKSEDLNLGQLRWKLCYAVPHYFD